MRASAPAQCSAAWSPVQASVFNVEPIYVCMLSRYIYIHIYIYILRLADIDFYPTKRFAEAARHMIVIMRRPDCGYCANYFYVVRAPHVDVVEQSEDCPSLYNSLLCCRSPRGGAGRGNLRPGRFQGRQNASAATHGTGV